MSNQDIQEEEKEVLSSIYDSDERFKELCATSYTYRIGEVGEPKTFLLEISWGDNYPDELPTINLDAFYNNHLNSQSKSAMHAALTNEAEGFLGSPMTYSLFEFAKENADELVVIQPETLPDAVVENQVKKKKKEKKEILTKNQKRRLAERTNAQGELPRGWDWVDVIKLSKTGSSHQ